MTRIDPDGFHTEAPLSDRFIEDSEDHVSLGRWGAFIACGIGGCILLALATAVLVVG